MGKFIIECPSCNSYAEASTGFFAKRKINCTCGNVINVKVDKFTNRVCAGCGNSIVFDQSKGTDAKCPVCALEINTVEQTKNYEEFTCSQCAIRLQVNKGATNYECPVCDHVNDVQERLMAEKIKNDGLASVIKYEGDNETFVWKHPIEDFNYGSQLIVHESQDAIFFKDGQALDLFGAGRYTLETQQLPLLENIYGTLTDTDGTFHSEVYFINRSTHMGIKWGTDSKVRLFDPNSGLYVELGAGGQFNLRVTDSRKLLLKIVGTTGGLSQGSILGTGEDKGYFRSMVMTNVKTFLAQIIKEQNINVLEIDSKLLELSEGLKTRINEGLVEYGLEMPEFFVNRVITPDDDPNFRQMKQQYAAEYLNVREEEIRAKEISAAAHRKMLEAETAAKLKIIAAQGDAETLRVQSAAKADSVRLEGAAQAESYRAQAEAEAKEMQMKGYTYQQETARQVGLEAMQNGITGGEGGGGAGMAGGLGEIAGLGVTLGAMSGVMGMTKEALSPMMGTGMDLGTGIMGAVQTDNTQAPGTPASEAWECKCGHQVMSGKFCNSCGNQKEESWTCKCGNSGIIGNFCNNCGAKKESSWNCECGNESIIGKFCNNCGKGNPNE